MFDTKLLVMEHPKLLMTHAIWRTRRMQTEILIIKNKKLMLTEARCINMVKTHPKVNKSIAA